MRGRFECQLAAAAAEAALGLRPPGRGPGRGGAGGGSRGRAGGTGRPQAGAQVRGEAAARGSGAGERGPASSCVPRPLPSRPAPLGLAPGSRLTLRLRELQGVCSERGSKGGEALRADRGQEGRKSEGLARYQRSSIQAHFPLCPLPRELGRGRGGSAQQPSACLSRTRGPATLDLERWSSSSFRSVGQKPSRSIHSTPDHLALGENYKTGDRRLGVGTDKPKCPYKMIKCLREMLQECWMRFIQF